MDAEMFAWTTADPQRQAEDRHRLGGDPQRPR